MTCEIGEICGPDFWFEPQIQNFVAPGERLQDFQGNFKLSDDAEVTKETKAWEIKKKTR